MKKIKNLLAVIILLSMISGCQLAPEAEFVTSKNDGDFETMVNSEKTEESDELIREADVFFERVSNSAGTINYSIELENPIVSGHNYQLYQVSPRNITPEEAKTMANTLFGNQLWYEYTERLSKAQIEEVILTLMKRISDEERLYEYYEGDMELIDTVVSQYEFAIEQYREIYDDAPETIELVPCEWEFHEVSHYYDYTGIITAEDEMEDIDHTESIMATTTIGGEPYVFKVYNRSASDYRRHAVVGYINDAILPIDNTYSIDKPTEEDITELNAYVDRLLEELGFAHWVIDSCMVISRPLSSGTMGYRTVVEIVPTYGGVKVAGQNVIPSKVRDEQYVSDYANEKLVIEFRDHTITYFEYEGAMDIVTILDEDISLLSFEEIMEALKKQLIIDDLYSYSSGLDQVEANVADVEICLVRVRIKNNYEDFYLVPACIFSGTFTAYEEENPVYSENKIFAVINAIDGSVIDMSVGY